MVTREKASEWRTGLASNGLRNRSNLFIAILSHIKMGFEGESLEMGQTEVKTVQRSTSAFLIRSADYKIFRVGSGF